MARNGIRIGATAIALALVTAPTANAEPDISPSVIAYVAHNGGIVCRVLDDFPSVSGALGVMQGVENAGYSPYESGQIVGLSVAEICPRHMRLMQRFVDIYGGQYT